MSPDAKASASANAKAVDDDPKHQDSESVFAEDEDEDEDEAADTAANATEPSLAKLMSLARPEWPMLGVALVLMIGSEATGLITPIIIANAYDALVDPDLDDDDRLDDIHRFMGWVMAVHGVGIVAGFLRAAIMGAVGERMVARVRNRLYGAILRQEIAFFDAHQTGELVSRLGSDTTLLQGASSSSIPEAMLGAIKVLVSVSLMCWISLKLAGLTMGSVLVIFFLAVPFGKTIGKLSKNYQDVLGDAQTRATESIGAMRTVQSFAAEARESRRYNQKIGNPDDFRYWWPVKSSPNETSTTYRVGFFKALASSGFGVFIFGFGFALLYGMLWYGFQLVVDGDISLGELTAFQSYIFQIGFGLAATSNHVTKVFEAIGASGRIFFLLERVPAIPSSSPKSDDSAPLVRPDSIAGDIAFDNVNFAYPSRRNVPVLRDFSLRVPATTTTALVGSSGSGKSTIVALLQRFYDVDSGSVRLDGNDIKSLDLGWLRRNIGFVQQEPQLFGMTVRENVLYGLDGERQVSEEELESVCRDANAHDFITAWPNGYDTLVGERGVQLSGGQKQRIAIARALLTSPKLLLCDEATSALDAESEHLVQEAIDKVVMGRTVIIVAHRLSTIRRATQIVVMDGESEGNVADVGTHEELMGRCERYQDLIRRQQQVSE